MTAAPSSAVPHPLLADAPWLKADATRRVLAAIESRGHRARVVGGAVRNTLLARAVSDIDIATDAPPEMVTRLVTDAGLAAVPTGLKHGTITVVADHHPFEVTTLRRDVATDGRHATVAFTDDWHADASRRDFTMNALYCDAAGVLYDFVGGLADIERRRVRFIGDAHQRIREDYLRILRFFRFSAEYAWLPFDPAAVSACVAERSGLSRLSAERIRSELLKLLVAPAAAEAIAIMSDRGILDLLIGSFDKATFARLCETDRHLVRALAPEGFAHEFAGLNRLAALAGLRTPEDAARLMERLRLSRNETEHLAATAAAAARFGDVASDDAPPSIELARSVLYRDGAAAGRDGVLLAWSRSAAATDDPAWTQLCGTIANWMPPTLPVSGADVVALGVAPGRRVGEVLRTFEEWWIAAGFPSGKSVLDAELRRAIEVTKI